MPASGSNALGREQIRLLNQSALLNAIHRHGRVSRSDLATELRLSPAAVSAITATFIDAGMVVEAQIGTSTSVGRKPILLEINYDHAYVFGVKVTSRSLVTALTNLKAESLDCRTDELNSLDAASVIDAVAAATEQLLESTGVAAERLAGLGVSLPGVIQQETGQVRYSPLLDWYKIPFAKRLESKLSLPILLENDVNALAAAQAWFGHGHNHNAFLVVTLGRGVGMGIVIGGQVYRGPKGGAGELGHNPVTPVEPRVMPERPATLEELLSDDALLALAREAGAPLAADASPEELTKLAAAAHPQVLDLFRDAGELLGSTLAGLVNIFAPSLVVVSGEGVRNAPYFMPTAREALHRYSFGGVDQDLELVVDEWGDDAWARGAAGLAAARFLARADLPSEPATSAQLGKLDSRSRVQKGA